MPPGVAPRAPAPVPVGGDIAGWSQDAAVVGLQRNPLAAPDGGGTTILYTAGGALTWATPGGSVVFGDGSDGVALFDGTTTPVGSTLTSGNYTINRNVYYSAVTVNVGVTVSLATAVPPAGSASGYAIFCNGTLTNSGVISAAGGSATS